MKAVENGRELKKVLKSQFPGVKFTVRKSGYRYFHVGYTDGPAYCDVQKFLADFNDDSRDDIMTDLWVGSQYTLLNRSVSDENIEKCARLLADSFGIELGDIHETNEKVRESTGCRHWTLGQWARNVLSDADLRKPFSKLDFETGFVKVA